MGGYHHGDDLTQEYNLTWGNNTDKMTTMINLSYVSQGTVWAGDRDISQYPVPHQDQCVYKCSSATPYGRFQFIDPDHSYTRVVDGKTVAASHDLALNSNVTGAPAFDRLLHPDQYPGGINGDYNTFDDSDRFNWAPLNMMLTPSERIGAYAQLRYDITDSISMHVKALYNNRSSTNEAAPEPLFIGPWAGNGNRLDRIIIHKDQKYNPFGFTLEDDYWMARRPVEAGPRIYEQSVNTFYTSVGLEGSFALAHRTFYWDTTMLYAKNRADQVKTGAFNSAKIALALGDPAVCAADPKCVPINLFGGLGTLTPAMIDYVTFTQKDVSQQELVDISLNITGGLFDLPGGTVGLAAGYEYRKQDGFFVPDSIVTAGDSAGIPSSPTSGGYYVNEVYTEVVVPIASEAPAADMLDLTGAFRLSDYSSFGSTSIFKAGVRWKPVESLLLRVNIGQGFRAPGIGELYGSEARYDREFGDPCSHKDGYSHLPPATRARCEKVWGAGTFMSDYTQNNAQISIRTGGNRELRPEESLSFVASAAFSPTFVDDLSWADRLDLEVVFYRIRLDDAIRSMDAAYQINQCVGGGDDLMCQGITRVSGNGNINGFQNTLINIGGITTSGIDVAINYSTPEYSFGRLHMAWLSNFLLKYTEKVQGGEGWEFVDRHGRENGDPEQAFPRFKSTMTWTYQYTDFSAALTARYIHSFEEGCPIPLQTVDGTCSDGADGNTIKAIVYNDIQVTWTPKALSEQFVFTLGVNNILNLDPPSCYSCSLNGFDATTHDIPGIFGYFRAGYRI
jgi:iron complex outermembrane receptor protein